MIYYDYLITIVITSIAVDYTLIEHIGFLYIISIPFSTLFNKKVLNTYHM
jgi:hypothetical protein